MSCLIDAKPAQTGSPKRSTATAPDVSLLQSTPSNQGISAANSYPGLSGASIDYLRQWVQKDIDKAVQCNDPDILLKCFLRLASNDPDLHQPSSKKDNLMDMCLNAVLPICNGQVDQDKVGLATEIKSALGRYTQAKKEADMYGPFIDASMAALQILRNLKVKGMRELVSEVDITLKLNNQTVIAQNHGQTVSSRKPDVIIIPSHGQPDRSKEDTKQASERPEEAKEKKKKKKEKGKVCWQDVLSIVEFKRYVKMDNPPTQYNVSSEPDAARPTESYNIPPSGPSTPIEPIQSGSSSKAQGRQTFKRKSGGDSEQRSSKRSRNTPPAETTQVPAKVQTALYGAEMLSANVGVNYVINFTVRDDFIWVTIFDHQGVISVGQFNFIKDLPRFMVLLFALQRFDLDNWGRVKGFRDLENGKTEVIVHDKNGNPIKLQLSNPARVPQIALNGRGTEVMKVVSADLEKEENSLETDGMVAKIYWAEERRDSEAAILEVVKKIAQVNDDVKGHVPVLLLSFKFQVSTSDIRMALGIRREDAERGSRTLYLLVFRELLPIWTLLSDPVELVDVWGQCVLCHYGLWKGNVHHRDISAANLMYYRFKGKAMGVVNDFDLATLAGSERKFGNERTGTIPFMAIELLEENGQNGFVAHRYRHEIESFIWVFIWVSYQYRKSDGTLRKGFLDQLGKVDAIQCSKDKLGYVRSFPQLPQDVDKHLGLRSITFLNFLQNKFNHRDGLKAKLNLASFELITMQDSGPTASELKGKIAEVKDELDGEVVDNVFRDFAEVIGFTDIEGKVERAVKGISAGPGPRVGLE